MLRYLTSGESHGECLTGILEGMPAGLEIREDFINAELKRRQKGYGRGKRMQIEADAVHISAGLRKNITIGSPIALVVKNRDFSIDELPAVTCARPGHADLNGALKYGRHDIRDILERASARSTAMRVAVGAVCKLFLQQFGIKIISHVTATGGVTAHTKDLTFEEIETISSASQVGCADKAAEKDIIKEIDNAQKAKDTLGGVFEVIIKGVPCGLGSHVQYDRKLDACLGAAVLSVQAVKAVEIGSGCDCAKNAGSQVHDEISYDKAKGFQRTTNRAGGIEGGISTGEDIIVKGHMKPIATLMQPLKTVDINTKEPQDASVERSDTCAVLACGVIAENVCAFEISKALLEKCGGDSIDETLRNFNGYLDAVKRF